MDDKEMTKYSRKVEYLVRKRHRMIRHIMSMFTKEGGFWLNCVHLNKDIIHQKIDVQVKSEKAKVLYALAISFGKIIDLSNVANTIYCCLQLFEEYKIFMDWTFTEEPFDLFIYPMITHSFQQLKQFDDTDEEVIRMHKINYIMTKNSKDLLSFDEVEEDVRKI